MLAANDAMRAVDNYLGSFRIGSVQVRSHATSIGSGIFGGLLALAGAAAGTNWTPAYASTDITVAGPGIITAFAILLDMMTGMGNWYISNAMGQLYIAMACLMFTFILIKSLFRHSGGKRR